MNPLTLGDLPADLLAKRPHLFSSATVPIAATDLLRMQELIAAVERVVALPVWHDFIKVGAGGMKYPAWGTAARKRFRAVLLYTINTASP